MTSDYDLLKCWQGLSYLLWDWHLRLFQNWDFAKLYFQFDSDILCRLVTVAICTLRKRKWIIPTVYSHAISLRKNSDMPKPVDFKSRKCLSLDSPVFFDIERGKLKNYSKILFLSCSLKGNRGLYYFGNFNN